MAGYRQYHDEYHAIDVLHNCLEINSNNCSPALLLAALYHDAVYVSGSTSNELNSAQALINDANCLAYHKYNIDFGIIHHAAELIKNTTIDKHLTIGVVIDRNLSTLLDADLWSLSADYYEFINNQKNILKENFLDPEDPIMLKKSAVFLKQFLKNRSYIYHTDYGREHWENRARENILRLCKETGV